MKQELPALLPRMKLSLTRGAGYSSLPASKLVDSLPETELTTSYRTGQVIY